MANFLWLLLIPLTVIAALKLILRKTITWLEAGVKAAVVTVVIGVAYGIAMWGNLSDTEILNGQVVKKYSEEVSCSHAYLCNCRSVCSGSGNSRTCSTVCSTCYLHPYDKAWRVITTFGRVTIDTIDPQGLREPPRWTAVMIGEPAAAMNTYRNYVKGAPNSLFNMHAAKTERERHAAVIPPYPRVYDYYRVAHAINVNTNISNLAEWDAHLDGILRTLGAKKQVNINVIFVTKFGREYKEIIERAWVGGKKNDVNVIIGVDSSGKVIEWVEAFTFGKTRGNELLAVMLRDELQSIGTTEEPERAVNLIGKLVAENFNRREMAEYEYLKSETAPSATAVGWIIAVSLTIVVGLGIWFHYTDLGQRVWSHRRPSRWR